MADGKAPRKWSLEEIDELLQDSGMLPKDDDSIGMVDEVAPIPKTEVFDPRPSHNKKIKHRIIRDTIEKSDSVAEPQVYGSFVSEKYRDRFFNNPVQNLEKTAIHTPVHSGEKADEQGRFIRKNSKFLATTDFSPVKFSAPDEDVKAQEATDKTMVFDDVQHTRTIGLRSLAVTDGDAHDIEIPGDEEDMQLSLEGFHTQEVEIVDESEIEKALAEKRKEKVSTFRITSEQIDEEPQDEVKKYGTDEYRTPDDKFKVAYYLKKKKTNALVNCVVCFACAFILLVMAIAMKSMQAGSKALIVASVILTIVPAVVNMNSILEGITAIKNMKPDKNSGCFISLVACIIQSIVFLFSEAPFESGLSLLSASAVVYIGINCFGEYWELTRISDNFSYLSSKEEIYSIGCIEKKATAFEIGRGLLLDEPAVLSSQKTLFPKRFIELSRRYYPSDEINKKFIPVSIAASIVIGALTLIISKSLLSSVTAFTASVCVSMPYLSYFADSLIINKISGKVRNAGGMLAGWDALRLCSNSNAIAIDSCDVLDSEGGNVHGIHPFYDIQIDEAIIYTATLAIASGGPLGNLFKRVIVGETSLLPPVDTLTYEDRLGLSAWIFNRRVLVGNEDLLRNHNVDIPDGALITRQLSPGRHPLYLAVDGKAAAVFIISYDVDESNKKLLREIESNSISLLIRSDDSNITDELISQKLSVHQSGVKVLSAISGDVYKEYVKETTSASDALLVHDGKAHSFLYAITSALSLGSFKSVIHSLQVCAMGIGIALVGALSFVSGAHMLGAVQLLLVQGIFAGLSAFMVLSGNALKGRKRK